MRHEIILTPIARKLLLDHLFSDPGCEQLAITAGGVHYLHSRTRILVRHVVLVPREGLAYQSGTGIALDQTVNRCVFRLAASEGLSQVDWHTHCGQESGVSFSATDDASEAAIAEYLRTRLPGTLYGSVVLAGREAVAARVWMGTPHGVVAVPAPSPFSRPIAKPRKDDSRFDRQMRAFGRELHDRLAQLRVGVVGLGGLGSAVVEMLARLGVRHFTLIDHDAVDSTNLNRLFGSTRLDVRAKTGKTLVARRVIKGIDPTARVKTLQRSVFSKVALRELTICDLIIAATDNHSSRLVLNALSCQYLIPLVHIGVHLQLDAADRDVSGEVAMPPLGGWCLLCAGIIDEQQAAIEIAGHDVKARLRERGYLNGLPAPAVCHLNCTVASLAVAEIHNWLLPYKPSREYTVYRALQGDLQHLGVRLQSDCPHCGPAGRLGLGDLAPLWTLAPKGAE